MTRALFTIILFFAVPLMIAYAAQYYKDRAKSNKKLENEWRAKLRAKEAELGRRLSVEEIQAWLVREWFNDRFRNAEDFARKIKLDLIERR